MDIFDKKMDIFDNIIYIVTGTEDGEAFVARFLDKENREIWVNYKKNTSSSFEYELSERKPKHHFDCMTTYEGRNFLTGVVINGYAELAPGIKLGLTSNTWVPNPNPEWCFYRKLEALK